MDGLQWYPRYVGDYARKTKHLSMLEHGAYNLLLDHYYATGKPLLNNTKQAMLNQCSSNNQLMPDHSRLYRLCIAITKEEQQAVDNVLDMFFVLNEDGYYINEKAQETIEKQQLAHQRRVNAGKKGGKQSPSKADSNAPSNAKAKPKQPEPEPEPYNNICDDDFNEFFKYYPRQIKQDEARELFIKLVEGGQDPKAIIDATKNYANEQAGNNKKFIKSPVTFLKSKTFLEPEYSREPPKGVDKTEWPEWQLKIATIIGDTPAKKWFDGAEITEHGTMIVKDQFKANWIKQNYKHALPAIGVRQVGV